MATIEDLDLRLLEQRKGFATEQTLEEIRNLMDEKNKKDNPQGGLTQANVTKQTTKQTKELGSSIARMHPVLGMVERGFNALGNAISGAAGLVMSVAQADGSFKSLIPVVDQAADMLGGFFGKIPLFGGLFGGISDATAEFTKLRLALMDMQVNTFRTLSRAGLDASTDMDKLQVAVLGANISMAEFEAIVSQSANGIRVYGGTLDDGLMNQNMFLDTIDSLTSSGTDLGKQLALLGLSSEQVVEEFAYFLESNRFNTRMMLADTTILSSAMAKRLKNERIMAELTGLNVDEQRKQRELLIGSGALQFALQDKKNASAIIDFGTNLGALSPALMDAFTSVQVMGNLTSDQQGMFETTFPRLAETIQYLTSQIEAGTMDADTAFAQFTKKAIANTDQAGYLSTLSILQDGQAFQVFDDYYKMLKQIDNQIMKAGDTDLAEYVKNQKANLDAVTDGSDELSTATGDLLTSARKLETAVADFQQKLVDATKGLDGFITDTISLMDRVGRKLVSGGSGLGTSLTTSGEVTIDTMGGEIKIYNGNIVEGGVTDARDAKEFMHGDSLSHKDPKKYFFGGGLFPGMTALVGEAGPELVSMGNSFGEVMSNSDTQSLFGDMKSMMDSMMPALQSGDLSGVMSQMDAMKPQLESSLKTIGGEIESKVGNSEAMGNLQSTMSKANADFQKESVNYASQNQQTLIKIEKLLKDLLPKALSGNGYF